METKDFIRTENYNLRLKPAGARKIVNEFSSMLNKKVSYQGKESTWSYVIFLKIRELAHYLTSKKEKLDFVKPEYEIERIDSYAIRQKILNALILLNCYKGEWNVNHSTNEEISRILNISMRKIDRVKKRFVEDGLDVALNGEKRDRIYADKQPRLSWKI
jgi:hypothetical protein